jgi:hypothetical protein
MELIDSIADGFYLAKKLGFVLLVHHDPMLDVGHELHGVQPVDGLVKIVADGVELLSERDHIGQKVIYALVPVPDVDRLVERDPSYVIPEILARCLPEKPLQSLVFGLVEAGIDPFVSDFFFVLHFWNCLLVMVGFVFAAADFGGAPGITDLGGDLTRSNVTVSHLYILLLTRETGQLGAPRRLVPAGKRMHHGCYYRAFKALSGDGRQGIEALFGAGRPDSTGP